MATKKTTPAKSAQPAAPDYTPILKDYEGAVRLLQEKKYDRAKSAFEKLLGNSTPQHIADRARLYMQTCNAKLADAPAAPKGTAEQYDAAVALMNEGSFDQARTAIEKLIKSSPEADYAHYGMAVLSCIAERPEEALRHLQKAIELNPQNRIQARNDSDFQNMADDPRFTELLYPEAMGDTASPEWRS